MKNLTHRLTFWGVRGSIPTGDRDRSEIGGDTSCVELTLADGKTLIFDMGTGIRRLGERLANNHRSDYDINIFLSHTHWDHILGFPFFQPVHQSHAHLNIYGPKRSGNSLAKTLGGLFQAPYFPLSTTDIKADISYQEIKTGKHQIEKDILMEVSPHPHPNGALSFRVEVSNLVVAYITDVEHTADHLVPSVVEIAQNADVLIHDSHFTVDDLPTHRAWGHSSWEQCVQVAQAAQVKQLCLFHFSPTYSDKQILAIERLAKKQFPNTMVARQDLTLEFPA